MSIESFPALNASLNALSATLLCVGYVMIRSGRRQAHRNAMLGAVATSTLFLVSYLYYHFHTGTTRFTGEGVARTAYFTILISHTILAALVPFLVAATLTPALRERFETHRRIARWTLPIWLYVSVTGVVIYVMLYLLYPGSRAFGVGA
ncbi:MAG: DUF420 domain-containing protein [Myxococcales bacterium]|nr:MAG: DUF420 domain-containing protein [Myxococcales bacterium]